MNPVNVLFVFADQWRAGATGFDGNPDVLTPHLDRFARESIHLPHAVSLCPVCTPWRASFLTGQTPDKHGLFLNDAPLNPDLPTLGKAFLTVSWGPPQSPYETAPEAFRNLYDPEDLHIPPYVPGTLRGEERVRQALAGYYAHCSALDECFGRLMRCLEDQNLAEDTLVVFTSDHGDFLGAYGLYDKQGPWDESARVPLLIHCPARFGREERRSELVFNTLDFYPTLCALAGVPVPPEAALDGHDHSGVLAGAPLPEPNLSLIAAYHSFGNWLLQSRHLENPLYHARKYRGIRTTRHTYVIDHQGPWLLYDNREDPHQIRNLVNHPDHSDVQNHLARLLAGELARLQDDFPHGADLLERWGYVVTDSGTLAGHG